MKTINKQNVDVEANLAGYLEVQGKRVAVRRYWLEDHLEHRFPYKDKDTGKRRFKCCRTMEDARAAAASLQEPVLTPAQAQAAIIQESVRKAVQDALSQIPTTPPVPRHYSVVADSVNLGSYRSKPSGLSLVGAPIMLTE